MCPITLELTICLRGKNQLAAPEIGLERAYTYTYHSHEMVAGMPLPLAVRDLAHLLTRIIFAMLHRAKIIRKI